MLGSTIGKAEIAVAHAMLTIYLLAISVQAVAGMSWQFTIPTGMKIAKDGALDIATTIQVVEGIWKGLIYQWMKKRWINEC